MTHKKGAFGYSERGNDSFYEENAQKNVKNYRFITCYFSLLFVEYTKVPTNEEGKRISGERDKVSISLWTSKKESFRVLTRKRNERPFIEKR